MSLIRNVYIHNTQTYFNRRVLMEKGNKENIKRKKRKKNPFLFFWFHQRFTTVSSCQSQQALGKLTQNNATTIGLSLTRTTTINQSFQQGSSEEAQRTPFVAAVGMAFHLLTHYRQTVKSVIITALLVMARS